MAEHGPAFPTPPLDLPHYHGIGVSPAGSSTAVSSPFIPAAAADGSRRGQGGRPCLTRRPTRAQRDPGFLDSVKGFGVASDHVPQGRHGRVPRAAEADRAPVPRPPPAQPVARRPGEVHRVRAGAWACPADAIYVEGADNTPDERFSPGERYGRVYQINYLRCILCGLCVEACPTRALTMTNEYELADDSRESLIWTKEQLVVPLQPDMEAPPHAMRLGDSEEDYYRLGAMLAAANQSDASAAEAARPGEPGASQ